MSAHGLIHLKEDVVSRDCRDPEFLFVCLFEVGKVDRQESLDASKRHQVSAAVRSFTYASSWRAGTSIWEYLSKAAAMKMRTLDRSLSVTAYTPKSPVSW